MSIQTITTDLGNIQRRLPRLRWTPDELEASGAPWVTAELLEALRTDPKVAALELLLDDEMAGVDVARDEEARAAVASYIIGINRRRGRIITDYNATHRRIDPAQFEHMAQVFLYATEMLAADGSLAVERCREYWLNNSYGIASVTIRQTISVYELRRELAAAQHYFTAEFGGVMPDFEGFVAARDRLRSRRPAEGSIVALLADGGPTELPEPRVAEVFAEQRRAEDAAA